MKNIKITLRNAIKDNDKKKVKRFIRSLIEEADAETTKKTLEFETYLMNNWMGIFNLETLNIPGSCTEGQVSHVLSERFSRNPMGWSKEVLGKLSCIRVSNLNGREITAEDFKKERCVEGYIKYAKSMIEDAMTGAFDWTIFDGEPTVNDKASEHKR